MLAILLFGLLKSERGATAVEYGIMVALIALVIFAAVATLGLAVFDLFDSVPDPLTP